MDAETSNHINSLAQQYIADIKAIPRTLSYEQKRAELLRVLTNAITQGYRKGVEVAEAGKDERVAAVKKLASEAWTEISRILER